MTKYKIIKQSTCESCGGDGVWPNPAWVAYNKANPIALGEVETMQWFLERDMISPKFSLGENQETVISFNFPDSELSCKVCGGRGWVETVEGIAADKYELVNLVEEIVQDIEDAEAELEAERQAEAYALAENDHDYTYFQQEMLAEFAAIEANVDIE